MQEFKTDSLVPKGDRMIKTIDDYIEKMKQNNNLCISLDYQKVEQDFKKNEILDMDRLYSVKSNALNFELSIFYTGANKSFGYEFRFVDFDKNRVGCESDSILFYEKDKTAIFKNLTNGINDGITEFGSKFDYMFNVKCKIYKEALNILEPLMVNTINKAEARFKEVLMTELEKQ